MREEERISAPAKPQRVLMMVLKQVIDSPFNGSEFFSLPDFISSTLQCSTPLRPIGDSVVM